jgi:hypothetical protein
MIRIVNAYTDTLYGSAPDVKSAEQFMRNNLLKRAAIHDRRLASVVKIGRDEKGIIFVYDARGTKFEVGYGS